MFHLFYTFSDVLSRLNHLTTQLVNFISIQSFMNNGNVHFHMFHNLLVINRKHAFLTSQYVTIKYILYIKQIISIHGKLCTSTIEHHVFTVTYFLYTTLVPKYDVIGRRVYDAQLVASLQNEHAVDSLRNITK